ncbi:ECF-type sigma factor [Xanthomonadaceae bacterium JHOS43]|nr:ECF-type sigma factor [Xanthomonadaceae bacterium JHOS43]MCX7563861.1 ECF-type sigma factor [Xanthomonadaceae bacterium XH05]
MNDSRSAHDITALLDGWRQGDAQARDALMQCVYSNVHAIAAQALRAMPGATLSATDLAHEAFLRLLGSELAWVDRQHFFSVAARATRQVLIDAARKRLSDKRGGNRPRVDLDEVHQLASPQRDEQLVRIDDALVDLAEHNPRHAQVIEMVYFGGLDRAEVGAALGLSDTTVDRDLRLARAWLKAALAP